MRGVIHAAVVAAALSLGVARADPPAAEEEPSWSTFAIESYPVEVLDSMAAYDARQVALRVTSGGLRLPFGKKLSSILVADAQRYTPGSTITVAFSGGDDKLRADVASVAQAWTQPGLANLTFSFRNAGAFRTWAWDDTSYRADIRIALNASENWSLIGKQSRDPKVEGGRPGQASMNFAGFAQNLPRNWKAIVIHEFGHALGFLHEFQHPAAACGFRFDNDPGYVETIKDGDLIKDTQGRRPGIYAFYHHKYGWLPGKIDKNLKSITDSSAYRPGDYVVTAYDKRSIMGYQFPADMFVAGAKSDCYADPEVTDLSDGDKIAVANAYGPGALARLRAQLDYLSQAEPLLPAAREEYRLRGLALERKGALPDK